VRCVQYKEDPSENRSLQNCRVDCCKKVKLLGSDTDQLKAMLLKRTFHKNKWQTLDRISVSQAASISRCLDVTISRTCPQWLSTATWRSLPVFLVPCWSTSAIACCMTSQTNSGSSANTPENTCNQSQTLLRIPVTNHKHSWEHLQPITCMLMTYLGIFMNI